VKTHILILCSMVFSISACSPAQPQVTVTLPPAPTPTLHPQFAALQEKIAASGGRFTLQADGLIYDGETPIPGLTVAFGGDDEPGNDRRDGGNRNDPACNGLEF
jgi:hypothetical protein